MLPDVLLDLILDFKIEMEIGLILVRLEKAVLGGGRFDFEAPPMLRYMSRQIRKVVRRYVQKHEITYSYVPSYVFWVLKRAVGVLGRNLIPYYTSIAENYHAIFHFPVALLFEQKCVSCMDCLQADVLIDFYRVHFMDENGKRTKCDSRLMLTMCDCLLRTTWHIQERYYQVEELVKNKQNVITSYFKPQNIQ